MFPPRVIHQHPFLPVSQLFVPLQYQMSEYDCVPTAVINAVACLFQRAEVPPMVVRHIYMYSLDTVDRGARLGRAGTSKMAIRLLRHWLGTYRAGRFSLSTEYLEADQVHVREHSPILACLREGGVALLNVRLSKGEEHFVTAMAVQDSEMLCWDPYFRTTIRGLQGRVRQLESDGRAPNLGIRFEQLDAAARNTRFSLGPVDEREALLMWRTETRS